LPLERDISLPGSNTAQHMAPEIALLTSGRCSKRSWIERLTAGRSVRIHADFNGTTGLAAALIFFYSRNVLSTSHE
jgi:hypothetical protein